MTRNSPDEAQNTSAKDLGPTLVVSRAGGTDQDTQVPLKAGTILCDDYRIQSVLLRDDASITYEADDLQLGVPVTIKEYFPSDVAQRDGGTQDIVFETHGTPEHQSALDRFVREAQTLVRLHHANVVRAHRVFEANGSAYIVLDYEDSKSLQQWSDELGRKPSQTELDRIVGPVLDALAAIHAASVLHRDICPDNILIRASGTPVITGFGSARIEEGTPSNVKSIVIASDFTAPEVMTIDHAKQGPATDIYGLAATLYYLVTGKRPISGGARLIKDGLTPASLLAGSGYREEFLTALDAALSVAVQARPQSIAAWEGIRGRVDDAPPIVGATVLHEPVNSEAQRTQPRTAFANVATQVATQLEKLPDPENLGSSAEKLFQPVALASAFTGLALYAIGTGFGVAAMLEILAIAMMFLHGFLPMHHFLNSESSQPAAILENVETATKRGAWSICSILFLMAVLPLLASRYLPQNPDAPFELLTLIVGVPALLMMMFALTSTPAKPGLRSRVFGIFNILIILYVLLLWVLFLVATTLTTNQPSTVGAVGQFNRYIYFVGPLAAATLGIYVFLCRMAAKQRFRHGAWT
ncbi:membrane protein of unknown function [Candidatus Filomicrobium marinum]|uniref:Protein kinase domain-containing protein n=1 Tax=Candidatus Filomicrobium marinum TaxID=1608628 RepID=A0A0D6JGX7_9HYPH|nr:serine/threonine-protein kinase [Candidatus Filomicrobium marinum]CFX47266.1 membrane protein of unknown function [Candidatus Filomicrobium marinum]CPR20555.1 membrane protein of unknown function [Candidatus Filomicrobium marinum]